MVLLILKEKLELLKSIKSDIDSGILTFDPIKENFGFEFMDQLFDVSEDEIKGYPCICYNKISDSLKYGVKIIPLENNFEKDSHPANVEIELLKEFTKLVDDCITPHITYYLASSVVSNKKKALVKFPLKSFREDIYSSCNVLISEYVSGGSIEEWIKQQVNIEKKHWKYIIFSIVWTLMVLGDRYHFMHNDFHYGNILIDTDISVKNKKNTQYILTTTSNEVLKFNIPNVSINAKVWDLEYSRTFKDHNNFKALTNDFFKEDEEDIPSYYNSYYDLHYFLISILELDIPADIREFILKNYPKEVIPKNACKLKRFECTSSCGSSCVSSNSSSSTNNKCISDSSSSRSNINVSLEKSSRSSKSSQSCSCSDCCDNVSMCTEDMFYKTDEDSNGEYDKYQTRSSHSSSSGSSRSSMSCESKCSGCSNCSVDSDFEETDYLIGDRLKTNDLVIGLNLPTPLSLLKSDFFAEYKKPSKAIGIKFEYKME